MRADRTEEEYSTVSSGESKEEIDFTLQDLRKDEELVVPGDSESEEESGVGAECLAYQLFTVRPSVFCIQAEA